MVSLLSQQWTDYCRPGRDENAKQMELDMNKKLRLSDQGQNNGQAQLRNVRDQPGQAVKGEKGQARPTIMTFYCIPLATNFMTEPSTEKERKFSFRGCPEIQCAIHQNRKYTTLQQKQHLTPIESDYHTLRSK
jgi:hypothetical protein